jgi:hypothetical protein
MEKERTRYLVITTLPAWVLVWVNSVLIFVAELSGHEVFSSQSPYSEESERAGDENE